MYKWLQEDYMVLNPEKCHYMLMGINSHDHKIILNGVKLKSNNDMETTRSIIRQKLNYFDVYI